jgi:hypothetical protein
MSSGTNNRNRDLMSRRERDEYDRLNSWSSNSSSSSEQPLIQVNNGTDHNELYNASIIKCDSEGDYGDGLITASDQYEYDELWRAQQREANIAEADNWKRPRWFYKDDFDLDEVPESEIEISSGEEYVPMVVKQLKPSSTKRTKRKRVTMDKWLSTKKTKK